MKLVNLLDVIEVDTMIGIIDKRNNDFVFVGFSVDAEDNIPKEVLFGEVESLFEGHSDKNKCTGFNIVVNPYTT